MPRAELLAAAGAPAESWTMGKGKVKADATKVDRDTWTIAGAELAAEYRDGVVKGFFATRSEEEEGGRDLTFSPLHFATKPADAPEDAALVGKALLFAWAAEAHGLPAKHVSRDVSPRTLLGEAGKALTTVDFAPQLSDFLWNYSHDVLDREPARTKRRSRSCCGSTTPSAAPTTTTSSRRSRTSRARSTCPTAGMPSIGSHR